MFTHFFLPEKQGAPGGAWQVPFRALLGQWPRQKQVIPSVGCMTINKILKKARDCPVSRGNCLSPPDAILRCSLNRFATSSYLAVLAGGWVARHRARTGPDRVHQIPVCLHSHQTQKWEKIKQKHQNTNQGGHSFNS